MPVLRFHLLTIKHEEIEGGFLVTITTNAACHLYLRHSHVYPCIHNAPILRRGLVIGYDARYCFVAYHHIEQNEEGDTWTHTFTWPGWQVCWLRYFYFWGTMGGQDMVSDTPIFWLHYAKEEEFIEILRPNGVGLFSECEKWPDTGENYEKVNDIFPDYVFSFVFSYETVTWSKDLYHHQDHTLGTGIITEIKLHALCMGHESPVFCPGIYFLLYPHEQLFTLIPEEGLALRTEDWVWKTRVLQTNPETELPWTWADIDALQAGVWLGGSWNGYPARCTTFYIKVTFVPPE